MATATGAGRAFRAACAFFIRRQSAIASGPQVSHRPDTRWCSDGEIGCHNSEWVRIACTLDCCDRKARRCPGWATTGGIDSSDIRVESLERRFGLVDKLAKATEWLSDNGSPYRRVSDLSTMSCRECHGTLQPVGWCTARFGAPSSNAERAVCRIHPSSPSADQPRSSRGQQFANAGGRSPRGLE